MSSGTWQFAGKAQGYTLPDGRVTAKQARRTQAQQLWTCDWEGRSVQRRRARHWDLSPWNTSHPIVTMMLTRPHCWGFSDIWASTSLSRNNFSLPNWWGIALPLFPYLISIWSISRKVEKIKNSGKVQKEASKNHQIFKYSNCLNWQIAQHQLNFSLLKK